MAPFSKKKQCAIRVDKTYDGFKRTPDFIVGTTDKIDRTIREANKNSDAFADMQAHEDSLPTPPIFKIEQGSFGFADKKMDIPVVARFLFTFDTDERKTLGKHRSGFSLRGVGYLLAIIILVFTAGSMFVTESLRENAQALSEIATQCIVFTENGTVKYVSMFGERHYFNVDGTPPLLAREVTPHEQMRLDKPFTHCEWNSNDGVLPYQLYP